MPADITRVTIAKIERNPHCEFVVVVDLFARRLRGATQIWMHAAFRCLIALQNIARIPIVYVLAFPKSL